MPRDLVGLLGIFVGITFSAGAAEISYTLPSGGRVSLAIYDSAGRQVRTLLNVEFQKAGPQTVAWDGLDREGGTLPAGVFTWKLVRSSGIMAEYLLSLGTSVGIHHWPGQHGGPDMVALDGDSIIVGGTPEGSPLLAKIKLDGTYQWAAPNPEPTGSADMASDGDRLYCLLASSRVHVFSTVDGKRIKRADGQGTIAYPVVIPVVKLDGIPLTQARTRTIEVPVPVADGNYLLRLKVGPGTTTNPFLSATVQGHWTGFHNMKAGEFKTMVVPEQYNIPAPAHGRDGKLVVKFECHDKNPGTTWSVPEMELVAPVNRIDARDGAVVVLSYGAETVAWIDPENGKILFQAKVLGARDLTLLSADEVLVATGKQVVKIKRGETKNKVVIDGLITGERLSVDRATGQLWLAEGGLSQQIKCIGSDFKLQKTFGRKGGRRSGLYKPEDFLAVADIIGDGRGGFIVVESQSAPRRTAHFDGQGKLLKEWYGGQQFYTCAVPEPDNPNLVWMDSQWNWIMQVEVDYGHRSWKVRACYEWNRDLDPQIFSTGKMASRMYPFRADLAKSGTPQNYIWFQGSGLLMRIDEPSGRMLPVACLGRMFPNQFWQWHEVAKDKYPSGYKDALSALGKSFLKLEDVKGRLCYGWADANGDGIVQGSEMRLRHPQPNEGHGFHGGPPCLWIDEELRRYGAQPGKDRPAYEIRSPVGRTACGAPIWDWDSTVELGPTQPFRGSRGLRKDPNGFIYQLLDGGGDGYAAGLDSFHSHGATWPGTLTDRTGIVKYGKKGEVLWQVGNHAARWKPPVGQVHNPVAIAGFCKGCVGICDYFVKPCYFWTDDGLYVGELLDHHVDEGLPPRVYSWWRADQNKGDEFNNLALFQYDMLVGGSLVQLPSGEIMFFGAGWNNVPVYLVHGLDRLARQQGTLELKGAVTSAAETGKGLCGEFYTGATPTGKPALERIEAQVWLGKDSHKQGPKLGWPKMASENGSFSARWTGQIEPRFTEKYSLALYLRGKARLTLGGVPLLDCWAKPGINEKLFSEPVPLQAGRKYPIVLEFSAAGVDNTEIHLCWESLTQGIEHVPGSALYTDPVPVGLPSLSLSPEELATEKGGKTVTITVRRTGPLDRPLEVGFTCKGTAVPGEHYRSLEGRVVIPPGSAKGHIDVVPLDDQKPDLTKSLLVALLPDPNYLVHPAHSQATVYLNDNRARPIQGATVLDASGAGKKAAAILVDTAGLDFSRPIPRHDTDPKHMWLSGGWTITSEWVLIDLGMEYHLAGLRLWNYNAAGLERPGVPRTNHGIKELEILTGNDREKLVSRGVMQIEEAPGDPNYSGQLLSLPVRVRYIRLQPKRTHSQHGANGIPGVGLAKVMFFGQPAEVAKK